MTLDITHDTLEVIQLLQETEHQELLNTLLYEEVYTRNGRVNKSELARHLKCRSIDVDKRLYALQVAWSKLAGLDDGDARAILRKAPPIRANPREDTEGSEGCH